MFDVKPNDCITTQEKLLYNIWQAVQRPVDDCTDDKPEKLGNHPAIGKCPVCGREWANNGQRLACARKHKKEGKPI